MDLTRLRTAQWLTIVGSVAGVLSLFALWESPYRSPIMVATVTLAVLGLLVEVHRDRVSVFFAGVRKLHSSFPQEMNKKVLSEIQSEYCYLGIAFTTVANAFRSWYESDRKANVRIRILLTDPDALDVLEFQARYEHNLFKNQLSTEEQRLVEQTMRRAQDAIKLTLDLFNTLPPNVPSIEIRFHREKLRKWMHFVNGDTLYLGILRAGESGLRSPAIVLGAVRNRWSLYDHYVEEIQSLWSSSVPATPTNLPTSTG